MTTHVNFIRSDRRSCQAMVSSQNSGRDPFNMPPNHATNDRRSHTFKAWTNSDTSNSVKLLIESTIGANFGEMGAAAAAAAELDSASV